MPGQTESYAVNTRVLPGRVTARRGAQQLATSDGAVVLEETGLEPVYYFPPGDVDRSLLQPSDHGSHCPLKGDASYWHFIAGDRMEENLAWCYRDPIPGCRDIAGYIAFYQDRVTIEITQENENGT